MNKRELRQYYLTKRKALTEEKVVQFSRQIHDIFFSEFNVDLFSSIHIFLPIRYQKEIDTWLIINTLRNSFSCRIIVSKSLSSGEMRHFVLEKDTNLIENKWKIPEPNEHEAKEFPIEAIKLVLIPMLIFDKSGNRVGYGKGYYDKFLSKCLPTTLKVGLSLFEPIEKINDTDRYDIRLDYCLTPNKIWKF